MTLDKSRGTSQAKKDHSFHAPTWFHHSLPSRSSDITCQSSYLFAFSWNPIQSEVWLIFPMILGQCTLLYTALLIWFMARLLWQQVTPRVLIYFSNQSSFSPPFPHPPLLFLSLSLSRPLLFWYGFFWTQCPLAIRTHKLFTIFLQLIYFYIIGPL